MARLSINERVQILRLHKQGLPAHQIAKQMSRSWWTVKAALCPTTATEERCTTRRRSPLMADREEIRAGIAQGRDVHVHRQAAQTIRFHHLSSGGQQPWPGALPRLSGHRAARCARRPKEPKLATRPVLRTTVEGWLEELWSPEQLAQRLRIEHPDDPMMWVSHETIYQFLFVQGRGPLKREFVKFLRTGRAERRAPLQVPHRAPGTDPEQGHD